MNLPQKKKKINPNGWPTPATAKGVGAVSPGPSSPPPLRITQVSAITNAVKTLPLAGQLGALIVKADDPNREFLVTHWREKCLRDGVPFIVGVVEGDRAQIEINGKQSLVAPTEGLDEVLLDINLEMVSP